MTWAIKDVDLPFISWGVLLVIGFLITQLFIFYNLDQFFYYAILWIIVIFIGFYLNYKMISKKQKKGSPLVQLTWVIFLLIGFVITALIYSNTFDINPYYLGAIWFIIIGLSLIITQGFINKESTGLLTGIIFMVFSIPAYLLWEASFLILAVGFGVTMILAGLYSTSPVK